MSKVKSRKIKPPIKKNLPKIEVKPPKVSVILSSYNHAAYIATAIQSVLNQTFTDFEFLIFDDGSTDNSREIIKSFKDPRIKTFLYEKNRGPHVAVKECLDAARGTYIAVHHSDDAWREDKLQKQVEILDANPNCLACSTWVDFIDEDGEPYELSPQNIYYNVFDKTNRSREEWLHYLFFNGNCFCHPSVLFRNDKNLSYIYNVNGLWQLPDYSTWIRLLMRADLYVVEERLTYFRLRRVKQDNTSAERPDTMIRSELELYHVLQEFRKITDRREFLKIFPEAEQYVVDGNILTQYALAKILQTSSGAARRLLALDILFDLLNDKNSAKKLAQWYNYTELDFARESAQPGILYPTTNIRYLKASLYYDTGAGFSEQNRIHSLVYVMQDGNFLAEFSIDADEIHALRFDPSEEEALAVKIISAQINGKDFELQANPPFKEVDGYQIFFTYDPQYISNYNGAGNITVQIRGNITSAHDALSILQGENFHLNEMRKGLTADLNHSRQEYAQANATINELHGEINSNRQQIENLNGEINSNRQQIENLNGEINANRQQIESLNGEINANHQQIESLNGEIADNHQQISGLNAQIEDLNGEINSNHQQIDGLNAQVENLNGEINSNLQQIDNLRGQVSANLQHIDNLNGEINSNRQQIYDLNGLLNFSRQQSEELHGKLTAIYSSRGYKLLLKYYALRDWLLPKDSTRRLFVKNLAWVLFNPKKALSLMNRDNLGKVISTLRHGGLRQLMIRSDTKLNSPAVTNIQPADATRYGNAWLDEKPAYKVPRNVVVDILIPIYNAVDFTRRCLETVYANTDVPFKLYLIDDCSPDERIKILLEDVQRWKKPKNLRGLKILRNEKNLGFIGTVNRGFEITNNNIVLLNTDTEVPPNWLSRLVRPLLEDEKIASATPFSNSAEICSFPNMCENNDLPAGLTVTELDKIFSRYGGVELCDMPTGIGFCMIMRRECIDKYGGLDTIFGKGYGEENDWCRRTAAQGYRHVHVQNLFVYHKHGASFAERQDKSKQQRLAENLAILNERYPGYDAMIQVYIHEDPAGANRKFLSYCAAAKSNVNGVMFLNHSMGGGATVYQNRIIAQLKKNWRVFSMEPLSDGRTLLVKSYGDDEEKVADFDLENMNADEFKSLLDALNINWLYLNQILTYPIPKIFSWIIKSKVPYTFFGHDFLAVCPRYQLLNEEMNYCGAETNPTKCNDCLKKSSLARVNSVDIKVWREDFKKFLASAKEVIVPSDNTAEIFQRYYSLPVTVREHEDNGNLTRTFREEFAREEILTVAVIGSIGIEKGSRIIYALADDLESSSLSIRLIVIGITNLHNDAYRSDSGKFEITGPYRNDEISNLLAKYKAGVVMIPSVWPETYSYTTTEAMRSGYPVIVFPIGAPSDRVRRTGGGWILKDISKEAVLDKLKDLVANRNEILIKAKNLSL